MKKISSLQFCSIEYFLILTNNTLITSHILFNNVRQDTIISIILGAILGIIPLTIYLKIINEEPELNIFEKTEKKYKSLGKLLNLILVLTIFFLIIQNYSNLIEFISQEYLSKTPTIIISLIFIPAIIYITNKKIKVIGRTIFILLIISIIFLFLTVLGLIWQIKIENILPILETKKVLTSSIQYATINITPLFLLTIIPKNEILDKEKLNKRIIITYIISNLIILSMITITLTVLGPNLTLLYKYPEYDVLKKISLIGFIERTESIISIRWIFYSFTLTIMGIFYISEYIKHTINLKNKKTYKKIVVLLTFIIVILSNILKINNQIPPTIITITLIIIPLIIKAKRKPC